MPCYQFQLDCVIETESGDSDGRRGFGDSVKTMHVWCDCENRAVNCEGRVGVPPGGSTSHGGDYSSGGFPSSPPHPQASHICAFGGRDRDHHLRQQETVSG